MSARRFYTAIIEKARDGYGVFFPDLPGCTSFGKTIARAAENARVAAQAHAVVSIEFGDDCPVHAIRMRFLMILKSPKQRAF